MICSADITRARWRSEGDDNKMLLDMWCGGGV